MQVTKNSICGKWQLREKETSRLILNTSMDIPSVAVYSESKDERNQPVLKSPIEMHWERTIGVYRNDFNNSIAPDCGSLWSPFYAAPFLSDPELRLQKEGE